MTDQTMDSYEKSIDNLLRYLKKRRGYGSEEHILNKVQLELTTDCNIKCFNCDRSCRQAPSKGI